MRFQFGLGRTLFAYLGGFFALAICIIDNAPPQGYIWILVPSLLACIGARRY
ncbi:MAG: hypothetical protein NVSMB65_20980 [Chloroflexota bacterium]